MTKTNQKETIAERVDRLVRFALYRDEELEELDVEDGPPEDAILVPGIRRGFGFHPERIEEIQDEVGELVDEIVQEPFFADEDGGWSFLNLAETRDGIVWGQHPRVEEFCAIAIGSGWASQIPIPGEFLPGGMPYYVFYREPKPLEDRESIIDEVPADDELQGRMT